MEATAACLTPHTLPGIQTRVSWPSGSRTANGPGGTQTWRRTWARGVGALACSQPRTGASRGRRFKHGYTGSESSARRKCVQSQREPSGTQEMRERADGERPQPSGRQVAAATLLVGNHRRWQSSGRGGTGGGITCISFPEKPRAPVGTWQTRSVQGEDTFTWGTARSKHRLWLAHLPAGRHPASPDAHMEPVGPGARPDLSSPLTPHRALLETREHTPTHTWSHAHTCT